jgi:NADH-quinone oxidoreductase subunit K
MCWAAGFVHRPAIPKGGAVIVPLNHILLLSALLFTLGMFCTLARRNLIMMLLGIEIMLNAAAVAFVGASLHWQQMEGQAIVIFILAVAATEVSIGLAAILVIYRRTDSVDPDMMRRCGKKEGQDSHATGNPDSHQPLIVTASALLLPLLAFGVIMLATRSRHRLSAAISIGAAGLSTCWRPSICWCSTGRCRRRWFSRPLAGFRADGDSHWASCWTR